MADYGSSLLSTRGWDDHLPTDPIDDDVWDGTLTHLSDIFDKGAQDLNTNLQVIVDKLKADPGNAGLLADYQAALSEYTLYRSVQSKTIEALSTLDKGTVNRLA